MRRIQIAGLALAVVLIGVTVAVFAIPSILNGPVCGGGVYDAKVGGQISVDLGQPFYNLTFVKNGVQETGYYYGFMSSAVSWTKSNTPSNAVFMNWWDYGKEVVGCTGRSSVISNPSARFIALGFSANQTERDSEQALTDVGTVLFTTNATLAHSVASKYGAGYLLITVEDGGEKAPYILQYLGLKPNDYFTSNSTAFVPTDWTSLGQQTLVYRLLDGQSVSGFTQVYSDDSVKIFSVS
ncbi:MAG: hypothetical protein JRN45_11120 [Nitrososphaerota archaeon]|nr:hypothetical protein [Nitrososphaerota archaeon]